MATPTTPTPVTPTKKTAVFNTAVDVSKTKWFNYASGGTPISADNLNRSHDGLQALDERVIELDFVVQRLLSNRAVTYITHNDTTGQIWLYNYLGQLVDTIDLDIEKVPVSFSLSSNGILTMTTSDGTTYTANIGDMIQYFTYTSDGKISVTDTPDSTKPNKHTINISLLPNSIVWNDLSVALQNKITDHLNACIANAKLSMSYAIGGSGARVGENTDNSKYYKEQAAILAKYAKDATTIGDFTLDSNGNLLYEDNTVHKFEVHNDGNLYYEVIV